MSARSRAIRERERELASLRRRLDVLGEAASPERRKALVRVAELVGQGERESARHASGHDDRMRFRARETGESLASAWQDMTTTLPPDGIG